MDADEWIKDSIKNHEAVSSSIRKEFIDIKKIIFLNRVIVAVGFAAIFVSMYLTIK